MPGKDMPEGLPALALVGGPIDEEPFRWVVYEPERLEHVFRHAPSEFNASKRVAGGTPPLIILLPEQRCHTPHVQLREALVHVVESEHLAKTSLGGAR